MLLIFFIPYINIGVAFCVKWVISVMNHIVTWVENLPYSIVKGLYVNTLEFTCLIIALLLLMLVVEHKKKKLLFGMLSILLIFSASQLTRAVNQSAQMSLTVYSTKKNTAIDFVCGNEHVMFCDTSLVANPSLASFSVDNNLIKEGVFSNGIMVSVDSISFENLYLKKRGNLISFGGKIVGLYDKNSTFGVKLPYRPHLDYFIISGRKNCDVEQLLNSYVIDLLIIDGTVPDYLSDRIVKKAEAMGQRCYNVKAEGAYVLKM